MNSKLVLGAKYRHYKGNEYKVIAIVKHSETEEDLVLYETLYENPMSRLWVRPLKMFLENVNLNGLEIPRFELVP